ncbi:magnesium transporter MgtE N-terminal domain-containing protein [Spirosoma utsteinense]|uniref:magnesium transporter MgtE N-terminal domain-containing protein n=1 Tax=Spirosoma utsteinense TaxID=2585773 RepID=UPI001ABCF4C3|nr:hypothetical protein [Spirosoma utsteinense]MBC3787788.1 Mg/Co/Ni transporter MgtE [Spirosoma utsteinense]
MPVTNKIIDDIHHHRWQNLRAVVPYLHPGELADLLGTLPVQEQAVFFRLMPEAVASETFGYLDKTEQQTLIRQLGQREVAALLNGIAPDDRTAFLEELPSQVLQQTLRLLTDDEWAIARTLLGASAGA